MTKHIDKFLSEIPIVRIPEILEDYETFRKEGVIGDCYLRTLTEDYMRQNGAEGPSILWLDRIGLETYRLSSLILMGKAMGIILKE